MGLDMYLSARIGYSSYDFDPEEKEIHKQILQVMGVEPEDIEERGYLEVDLPVGYWRKVNAIHSWFVEFVQEGQDDCKAYFVSRKGLKTLEDTCRKVLANPTLGPALLPTTEGFFFGGTDYGEWYLKGLEHTLKIIERAYALIEKHKAVIVYRSSW